MNELPFQNGTESRNQKAQKEFWGLRKDVCDYPFPALSDEGKEKSPLILLIAFGVSLSSLRLKLEDQVYTHVVALSKV